MSGHASVPVALAVLLADTAVHPAGQQMLRKADKFDALETAASWSIVVSLLPMKMMAGDSSGQMRFLRLEIRELELSSAEFFCAPLDRLGFGLMFCDSISRTAKRSST